MEKQTYLWGSIIVNTTAIAQCRPCLSTDLSREMGVHDEHVGRERRRRLEMVEDAAVDAFQELIASLRAQ